MTGLGMQQKKSRHKLNNLGIQVGYPDKIPALFDQFKTVPADQGGTLLQILLFSANSH